MAEHAENVRVVLITAPDSEVARTIARCLIEERLAACVNLLPGLTSVYRWEGAVEEANEVLMVVKTRAELLPELELRLAKLHPYDTPECVALAASRVEARYLSWLLGETQRA